MEITDLHTIEMPHSVEAEQTVLGALLRNKELLSDVLSHLTPESFYVEKHQRLFRIITRLFTIGTDADIITVLHEAEKEKIFTDSSEGRNYLATIANNVPTTSNIDSYCKIVKEKQEIRLLLTAAEEIAAGCREGAESADMLLEFAEQKIYNIRQDKSSGGLVHIEGPLLNAYDHLGKISGEDKDRFKSTRSGYQALDSVINGLNPSDLIILAARPGMGKTSFAMNIAANVCRSDPNKYVAVFSLEMSREQLVTRMLSFESLVSSEHLMKGTIMPGEWEKLAAGANRISCMQMYVDDKPDITVTQMKSELRKLPNLSLVVIDYLQLMSTGRRDGNRVQEISELTRNLKLLAKELNVPVITLSQLSRTVESRNDKRPMLSDLRESGSIEQDADIVLFLYRDGYYNRDNVDNASLSECIIAKNRHGETGTINLRWNGQYTLFMSEDRRPTAPQ